MARVVLLFAVLTCLVQCQSQFQQFSSQGRQQQFQQISLKGRQQQFSLQGIQQQLTPPLQGRRIKFGERTKSARSLCIDITNCKFGYTFNTAELETNSGEPVNTQFSVTALDGLPPLPTRLSPPRIGSGPHQNVQPLPKPRRSGPPQNVLPAFPFIRPGSGPPQHIQPPSPSRKTSPPQINLAAFPSIKSGSPQNIQPPSPSRKLEPPHNILPDFPFIKSGFPKFELVSPQFDLPSPQFNLPSRPGKSFNPVLHDPVRRNRPTSITSPRARTPPKITEISQRKSNIPNTQRPKFTEIKNIERQSVTIDQFPTDTFDIFSPKAVMGKPTFSITIQLGGRSISTQKISTISQGNSETTSAQSRLETERSRVTLPRATPIVPTQPTITMTTPTTTIKTTTTSTTTTTTTTTPTNTTPATTKNIQNIIRKIKMLSKKKRKFPRTSISTDEFRTSPIHFKTKQDKFTTLTLPTTKPSSARTIATATITTTMNINENQYEDTTDNYYYDKYEENFTLQHDDIREKTDDISPRTNDDCPGSLEECINVCVPLEDIYVYSICVKECGDRCK